MRGKEGAAIADAWQRARAHEVNANASRNENCKETPEMNNLHFTGKRLSLRLLQKGTTNSCRNASMCIECGSCVHACPETGSLEQPEKPSLPIQIVAPASRLSRPSMSRTDRSLRQPDAVRWNDLLEGPHQGCGFGLRLMLRFATASQSSQPGLKSFFRTVVSAQTGIDEVCLRLLELCSGVDRFCRSRKLR